MTKKMVEFLPEAAVEYAKNMSWKLPKALKSKDTLLDIMRENVDVMVKDIPPPDRYECQDCGSTVGEPDDTCWYCGCDLSDDGTGGFKLKEGAARLFEEDVPAPAEAKPKAEPKPKPKEKAEEKAEEKSKALKKAEKAEKPITKKLAEYTQEIKRLDSTVGGAAWRIGKFLLEIKDTKAYSQGGYAVLADYVLAELEYSWQAARNYMRYASIVDEKHATLLGTYKMEVIARAPEEARPKLLQAALPKPDGQGLPCSKLEARLKAEQEKARAASGKSKQGKAPGRKPQPNKRIRLHDLIDTSIMIRMSLDEGSEGMEIIPESACLIEAKTMKSGIKISFYQQAEDEED